MPPLVTDIDLSVDDRFLYVSCWGTGELRQYDVSDPFHPVLTGLGAARRHRRPHGAPGRPGEPLAGGPQMVEISRDGRRVYCHQLAVRAWDDQFYPDGVGAWMAKLDVDPDAAASPWTSGSSCTARIPGLRPHQTRLQGGDASSDSYCYRVTGLADPGWRCGAGRVPRDQPGDGLALRGRPRVAGAPPGGAAGRAAADRARAPGLGGGGRRAGRRRPLGHRQHRAGGDRRGGAGRLRAVAAAVAAALPLGRDAGVGGAAGRLVVPDGARTAPG